MQTEPQHIPANEDSVFVLLEQMQVKGASDLYLTFDAKPMLRIRDRLEPAAGEVLTDADIAHFAKQIVPPGKWPQFEEKLELNTAFDYQNLARFRINVYRQRGHTAMVIRRINMQIPSIVQLGLPQSYAEVALIKRGLILVAGPTGSGKSTSLAAMVGHRNLHGTGHIITVEDPIEFVHQHQNCIVSQRDIGLDTESYAVALKHALRQQPDMVVIGEVRDREVMEQALYFAETSHLCIATIHANNSSQVIERVLNFFPEEMHQQVLMNLSLNLRAVFTQRMVDTVDGKKTLALEIMLNRGLIRQHIAEGKIPQIKEMIEKGSSDGMRTFDQDLLRLYKEQVISEQVAMNEADSATNLGLMIGNEQRAVQHAASLPKEMVLKAPIPQLHPDDDTTTEF